MRPARPGVHVDGVDRTDVDTEHAVDTLVFVGRFSLDLALRVVRRVDPREHVDGAVLEARAVGETDVEVDGDVGAVDAEFLRRVDRSPDVDAVVLFDTSRFWSKFESMAIGILSHFWELLNFST